MKLGQTGQLPIKMGVGRDKGLKAWVKAEGIVCMLQAKDEEPQWIGEESQEQKIS